MKPVIMSQQGRFSRASLDHRGLLPGGYGMRNGMQRKIIGDFTRLIMRCLAEDPKLGKVRDQGGSGGNKNGKIEV